MDLIASCAAGVNVWKMVKLARNLQCSNSKCFLWWFPRANYNLDAAGYAFGVLVELIRCDSVSFYRSQLLKPMWSDNRLFS